MTRPKWSALWQLKYNIEIFLTYNLKQTFIVVFNQVDT